MATVVLVHCGFARGWIWRAVATHLRAAGHEVFTPTLKGLGERARLAQPDIDLTTHVQDVLGVLICENLQDVVSVGSSSGSMVITGVVERLPARIAHLFYLDTPVPQDGQFWVDLLTSPVAAPVLVSALRHGDGWGIPPPGHAAPPRWSAHPLKSVTQLIAVRHLAAAQARARGWPVIDLPTDHFPMLSQPHLLAIMLGVCFGTTPTQAQILLGPLPPGGARDDL